MKNIYNVLIVALIFCAFNVTHAQSKIKRASISSSVNNANNTQNNGYKLQHSIGHMGIMGPFKNLGYDTLRGFLFPQYNLSTEIVMSSTETRLPDFDMDVYPNPFIDHINISISIAVSGDMAVRLYDITGQLIMEILSRAKKEQRIELSHLARSQYLLSIEAMGKIYSYKLLNFKTPAND